MDNNKITNSYKKEIYGKVLNKSESNKKLKI